MLFQNNLSLISSIVFDLDGTLIDSAPSILKCLQVVLKKNGYRTDLNFTESLIGPPLRDVLKSITSEQNEEKIDTLIENFKIEYDQNICNLAKPYIGIHQLLVDLKLANKKIFIVTNKRQKPTKKIIDHLKWNELIDCAYNIDYPKLGFQKKSQVINQLIDDYSLDRDGTCYVGDRAEDYEAAYLNGLLFIHAAWGYGANDKIHSVMPCMLKPSQLNDLLTNRR